MNLLLVIPYHHGDRGQVERLGKWMRQLSGGKRVGSKLLFCGSSTGEVKGIGDNFVGLFDEIKAIKQLQAANIAPGQPAWPRACNLQFLHLAKHVFEERKDVDAFYYFEPDNLPLCADWYEKVIKEYESCGKSFWGAEASYIERSGTQAFIDGSHMIGTGIYPQDAWKRIKGYADIEKDQPNRPWDALTRNEVNPQCFFTNLVMNVHSCRGFREVSAVYRLPLEQEMKRRDVPIDNVPVIFHGCKDSSLRLLVAQKLGLPQTDPLTFAHAGDIGDLIYALPSIKEKGGGILKLSPNGYAREKMTPERIASIAPLLKAQPYIQDVVPHDEGYVDFDFRAFRALHKQHSNLVQDQANWIGSPVDVGEEAWLTRSYPYPDISGNCSIIVNRTARYRNEKFTWSKIVKEYGGRIFFIGLNGEYVEFCKSFGQVFSKPTLSFLDVANVICGSEKFIGNQSACFAIAEGLKHPRIQETCPDAQDCIFNSETGTYCLDGHLPDLKPELPTFDIEALFSHPHFEAKVRELVTARVEELVG